MDDAIRFARDDYVTEELLLVPLVEFAQATADGGTFLVCQLGQWQFCEPLSGE